MSLITIEQVGESSKLTYTDGDVLYTWKDGRFKVSTDNDTIESINFALAPEDDHYQQTFKWSEQTNQYGTANAIELCEYLILNDIFFSDDTISTISEPEALKMTEVGNITYMATAKAGSIYADPVWKCLKFDCTDLSDQNRKWAGGALYNQIATDLTLLTYL